MLIVALISLAAILAATLTSYVLTVKWHRGRWMVALDELNAVTEQRNAYKLGVEMMLDARKPPGAGFKTTVPRLGPGRPRLTLLPGGAS